MARTGFFHHIGTFLLFAATILLIVTCVSSPVVNDLAILKVRIGTDQKVTFGTFGYCLKNINGTGWACTPSELGYSPAGVISMDENIDISHHWRVAIKDMTKAMVLHPISCGLNFIAFILALGAGFVGSFLASMVALLAFIVTVVIMIIDFVMFGVLRHDINKDTTSAHADFSVAMWTTLVSAICSLFGTIIVFFTCCSARIHNRRSVTKADAYNDRGVPTRRRNWL